MRRFRLNKLVRDKILPNMLEMGQKADYKKLDDTEFLKALQAKLLEETNEIDVADPEVLNELADLLEVVETIAVQLGSSNEELRKVQRARRQKRGAFNDRIFVRTLTLEDDDSWVEYYAKDPKKFPEDE